jgi:superfamily II DNA or RNA helicase
VAHLFPFQRDAVDAVFRDWARGLRALLISLPTGAGKTLVGAEVARRAYAWRGEPVLVLVPSDEILRQTVEEVSLAWEEVSVGVIQRERRECDRPIVVASVATLVRHLHDLPRYGLVITDEAHHAEAPMWQAIYQAVRERTPGFWHLGLTATPFRSDRKGDARPLTAVFEKLSYARSMFDLIAEGFLVHLRGIALSSGTALDGVTVRGDDYEEQALARVVNTPARNALVVHHYLQYCAGKRALCFAVNMPHAEALTTAFQHAGVAAVLLTGDTSLEQRRALLTQIRSGRISLIVTCGVLREGFNEPSVEAVICARPTQSRLLYIQQAGRVTRRWPGKEEGIILDLVDNTATHRPVSLGELLQFYGLRRAEVTLATVPERQTEHGTTRQVRLTAQTIAEIQSVAQLSPIVRDVDLFRLNAFAWHTARDDRGYAVSLYEGVALGVVAQEGSERYDVVATFWQERQYARLLPQSTALETAMLCANAFLFDFGDWRLATRHARWRDATPTAGQQRYLRRFWSRERALMKRVVGSPEQMRTRGQASGAISAVQVWHTLHTGTEISRTAALACFQQHYETTSQETTTLCLAGTVNAPVAGALRRYHRELHRAQPGTFADFLRHTLERCTFAIADHQVTVQGGAQTASYTSAQWRAIREALTTALGALGPVEVVIHPFLQEAVQAEASSHKPAREGASTRRDVW